jgi:ADP-ribose pyrophosphatase
MKKIESSTKYEGKILKLMVDKVELPSGRTTLREIVSFPNTVTLIPVLGDSIVFVNQNRYAVGGEILELPAGKVDNGESPDDTARRELEEETGFRCGDLKELLSFYVTPGYSTEFMRLYIAREIERTRAHPDSDEIIEPLIVPMDRARSMLLNGRLHDAKTILGLAFFFLSLGK